MEQSIRHPDQSTLTNRQITAVFADWHNLKAGNVLIYMWPQLLVLVPTWWKFKFKGTLLLRFMTSWIFAYFYQLHPSASRERGGDEQHL